MILKVKKVLSIWPDLEGGNWIQRRRELFPPKVMLGIGCKKGVSYFRKLDAVRRKLFPLGTRHSKV